MIEKKEFANETISVKILNGTDCPRGSVIILTGDTRKGSKGMSVQNFIPYFININMQVIIFDFTGQGDSLGDRSVLTLTQGLSDFENVFKHLLDNNIVNIENTCVFGTSFGACVALLSSEIVNKCKALVLRSPCAFLPIAYINDLEHRDFLKWRELGESDINGYKYEVLLDSTRYNMFNAAEDITTKTLIVQGENDEIVVPDLTVVLYDKLKCEKELILVENANHSYSSSDGTNLIWEWMALDIQKWIKNMMV